MFEKKSKPVIPPKAFIHRLFGQLYLTLALIAISLCAGVIGYRYFESLSWVDAFLNTSMLLGGMGEVTELKTTGGKLFASFFSLYSGLFMIICGGLLLAPVFHRILHHFHAEGED